MKKFFKDIETNKIYSSLDEAKHFIKNDDNIKPLNKRYIVVDNTIGVISGDGTLENAISIFSNSVINDPTNDISIKIKWS